MSEAALAITRQGRKPRPQHVSKAQSRSQILEAARRVAARDGARDLSLRSVAAEAGFAPAGLYGYFRSKDELLLALAADDLTQLARAMREAGRRKRRRRHAAGASGRYRDHGRGFASLAARRRRQRCRTAVQWPDDRGVARAVGSERASFRQSAKSMRRGTGGGGAGRLGLAGAFGPAGRLGFSDGRNSFAPGKPFRPSLKRISIAHKNEPRPKGRGSWFLGIVWSGIK